MQDQKMEDQKEMKKGKCGTEMQEQMSGVENAGPENA